MRLEDEHEPVRWTRAEGGGGMRDRRSRLKEQCDPEGRKGPARSRSSEQSGGLGADLAIRHSRHLGWELHDF